MPSLQSLSQASGRSSVQRTSSAGVSGRRWTWWRELGLVVVLYWAYNAVQASVSGRASRAIDNGELILHAERALHINPEIFLNHGVDHIPVLAVTASYMYAGLHFILTPAVLVWACVRRPASYGSARAVLAIMTLVALLGFWLFPTAPPRLLLGAGFQDTLQLFHGWGWWGGGASVPTGAHNLENPFAAMPSLHIAWATWSGATMYRLCRRRVVRVFALAYPAAMVLVVMATANHYLLDVIAGGVLWMVVDRAVAAATAASRSRAAHRDRMAAYPHAEATIDEVVPGAGRSSSIDSSLT